MTPTHGQRLRLRVEHAEEAVFDLNPEEVGAPGEPEVREMARSADDQAAGVHRYETTVDGWVFEVTVESAARAELRDRAGHGSGRQERVGSDVVKAQIPGRVVRLWVAEGDTVESGQRLLAIEAMKMENEVRAPRAGTVGSIRVAAASSVELGDELLTVR
jgi:oxaloacetate decarboxylase alpha subunit